MSSWILRRPVADSRPRRRIARWTAFGLVVMLLAAAGCAGRNYLMLAPPVNDDGTIHVVIENPAGSHEKWEVQSDGRLVQEMRDGAPLRIEAMPWPANGGMIPATLLSEELGGDREPVDVLVLGPSLAQKTLVRAVPIGLLHIFDRLERDDKVIAVVPDGPFGELRSVEELEVKYPGVREDLTRWYREARPGSSIDVQGYGSAAAARLLILECAQAFEKAFHDGSLPDWTSDWNPL